jgi:hypothetical protein
MIHLEHAAYDQWSLNLLLPLIKLFATLFFQHLQFVDYNFKRTFIDKLANKKGLWNSNAGLRKQVRLPQAFSFLSQLFVSQMQNKSMRGEIFWSRARYS